ncbi:MAG: SH3 domain-containing protein [Bdellovibrionota bacterium]
MIKWIGVLLGGVVASAAAFGAETVKATSVFEKPTYGSKQVEVLPANAPVTVVGKEYRDEGLSWIPVQVSNGKGWLPKESVSLASKDIGYEDWEGKDKALWLWFSAGPAAMYSDKFYPALRVVGGLDWYVNRHRRFFIGTFVSSPFSKEEISTDHSGRFQRYNTYFSVGYQLVPGVWFTRFGLGLSVLAGANRNFSRKFGASASAELGYQVPFNDFSKLAVSFSFEYTGKSRQSVNFFQDLYHCTFGGCDPSIPVPSAVIMGLNVSYNFAP